VKSGVRALGIAASDGESTATLAGAVVRADRVVDGFRFGTCTVGGLDSTRTICSLFDELGRADVQYLLCAGIAPAWFNVLDLHAIHEHVERPVLSVSFEASPGLDGALRDHFEGEELARRLDVYERQPPRVRVGVGAENETGGDEASGTGGGDDLWVRAVGCDEATAREVVRAYRPEGSGRPEPLRVARLVARASREQREAARTER
jgi:hypothetical protein